MKLKDWLGSLRELIDVNPEVLEMEMVSSSDDEGNSFNRVTYTPSLGKSDGDEFITVRDPADADTVCLN